MTANEALQQRIALALEKRKKEHALRELTAENSLVDFCSNDYLGIARQPQSPIPADLKTGSGGSRLIAGNSACAEQFEKFLAEYMHCQAALLYNSGYAANAGLISCLARRNDVVLYDELVHASIRDGVRLSLARSFSFRHNDLDDLEKKLAKAQTQVFVLVESVYSMDGDAAPLQQMATLCKKYNAALVVDEAHAFGVYGEKGRGLVDQMGISDDVFARVLTFGKAIGSHGAAVLGSKPLITYLINFSRTFIYTTALPATDVFSLQLALQWSIQHDEERNKLKQLIQYFTGKIRESDLPFIPSDSPIQCVIVPGNENAKSLAAAVRREGLDVRAILSPTVAPGKERIRITLHAFNKEQEVDKLIMALQKR